MPLPRDGLPNTEYQPLERGQPPVHFGERTGIQSVITSPWVLRWASIPATYAVYRQIRKHGTLAMARELKVAPVLASDWTIDADDGVPDEWKTFIEKTFFPLRDDFMSAALYHGNVDFGYECYEKIIEPRDGYLKLTRLKPLLHDITEICIGHKGGFIGVRQYGQDLGLANSLHVGFRVEGSYLYGIPLLENARQAYNWWIDCNEGARRYDRKIAGAHIVVEYPIGTSTDRYGKEVENVVLARQVLDSLEAAGGVAVPRDMAAFMQQLNLESPGWKIWILDAGASQQASFVNRLEYLDKLLCRCLHIPERSMMEGRHGTLAEAEAHSDVIFTIQDIEHRRVTDELNRQAVDQMLFLNFGRAAVGKVRLKASPIVDEKKAYFRQIYSELLASPVGQRELESLDAASLREQLGLPQVPDDPGDIEHDGARLQGVPGLSAGTPGGAGKQLMARGPDGRPVQVDGQAENPAAALANAVWGMREAIALSSTALAKATKFLEQDTGFISSLPPEDRKQALQHLREHSGIPLWELVPEEEARKAEELTLSNRRRRVAGKLADAIRRYEEGDDHNFSTVEDVVDHVESFAHEHPRLQRAVDRFRREQADNREFGYRGDMDSAYDHFMDTIGRMAEKHGGDGGQHPIEMAATDPVEQEPWRPDPEFDTIQVKTIPLGQHDRLEMSAMGVPPENLDPEEADICQEHGLRGPHDFQFKRHQGPDDREGSFDITGGGKAGTILSHMAQGLRELVDQRPMSVYFTAKDPSRIQAYSHLMRRLAKENIGGGQYEFLARKDPRNAHASYYIVHQAAMHLPEYQQYHPLAVPAGAAFSNEESGDREPLELAGTDAVQQPEWTHTKPNIYGDPGVRKLSVPIGDGTYLHFQSETTGGQQSSATKQVQQEHRLSRPEILGMWRSDHPNPEVPGSFDITGQGRAGLVLSHISQAIRTVLENGRPLRLTFTAAERSRRNAYGQMMRRLAQEEAGYGEYAFMHRPDNPGVFCIVHKAATGLPQHANLQDISTWRPEPKPAMEPEMAMSGATLSDVLGARPVAGRVAEDMDDTPVAMDDPAEHPELAVARRRYNEAKDAFDRHYRKFITPEMEEQINRGEIRPGRANNLTEATREDVLFDVANQQFHNHPDTARLSKQRQIAERKLRAAEKKHGKKPLAMADDWEGAQRKTIAPAIDAPEQVGRQPLSPGMKVLLELRARRQMQGLSPGRRILEELRARRARRLAFANEPEGGAGTSFDVAPVEYLGHGPLENNQYGIRFRTPEGERHLPVKSMKAIENDRPEDRMLHVTFHGGGEANVRMPESHRKEIFSQLLSRIPKPVLPGQQVAEKRAKMMQEAAEEAARRQEQEAVKAKVRSKSQPKAPKAALNFTMPPIPRHGTGELRRVASEANDIISNHFQNEVIPTLLQHHGGNPQAQELLAKAAKRDRLGKDIIGSIGRYGEDEIYTGGKVDPVKVQNLVPAVYELVLKDAAKWDPSATETVKDKETGESHEEPIDFDKHILRSIWRNTTILTRHERHDPQRIWDPMPKPQKIEAWRDHLLTQGFTGDVDQEAERQVATGKHPPGWQGPKTTSLTGQNDEGEETDRPVTNEDITRRTGESTAAEEEYRRGLAQLFMGPHLDKAGEEVFEEQARDPELKRARSRYGDEAVDERVNQINQLLPWFQAWMENDYQVPEGMHEYLPGAPKTKAENVLPIKKVAYGPEAKFLNQFTKDMSPAEKAAAKLVYFTRRQGNRIEDLAGHQELPAGFKYIHQLRPINTRLTKAVQQFDRDNKSDLWSKVRFRQGGDTRTIRQVYLEEPEHHAGVEEYIRDKLSQQGGTVPLMKILTQTMMGRVMPKRLHDDPELMNLAKQKYKEDTARKGKSAGWAPKSAKEIVNRYRDLFKQWVPQYFESVKKPELAQKYREKAAAIRQSGLTRAATASGKAEPLPSEIRKEKKSTAAVRSHKAAKALRQKEALDRDALNLPAVDAAFAQQFGERPEVTENRSQRSKAWGRDKLASAVLRLMLEHLSWPKIIARPEIQQIISHPGFFRSTGVERSDENVRQNLTNWWNANAKPVIQRVSPALHSLLQKVPKERAAKYHPLSQTPEIIAPE